VRSSVTVDRMPSRQKRLERIATLTGRLAALEHDRQVAIAKVVADGAPLGRGRRGARRQRPSRPQALPLVASQLDYRGDPARATTATPVVTLISDTALIGCPQIQGVIHPSPRTPHPQLLQQF
jgi:hypothetical protein